MTANMTAAPSLSTVTNAISFDAFRDERETAARLILAALAAGFTVSVCDGEAWPVKRSTDALEIARGLASTEMDILKLRRADDSVAGMIWLIWGNGADLVSDYTDADAIESVIRAAR